MNILSDCRILTFCCCRLNDVVYYVFDEMVLNALKSLDGNAAMPIILSQCMIITCC